MLGGIGRGAGSAIFPLSSPPPLPPFRYFPRPFLLLSCSPCSSSPLNFSLRLFFPENYVGANVCPASGSMYVSRLGFEICQRVVFLLHLAPEEQRKPEIGRGLPRHRDLTNSLPRSSLPRFFNCWRNLAAG